MGFLLQDIRLAVRMLAKSPAFTAVALVTLALGIGANTALFSIVNGVLLNPLAYPQSGRLVSIYEKNAGSDQGPIAYLNFLDWQRQTGTFSSIAIYRGEDYNFTGSGQAERLSGSMVSADFFSTLGVRPILGRTFLADDDRLGASPVVVLGGGLWKRRFGSSVGILGRSIDLNGSFYTVIGVIPADFTFYGPQRDVYTPIGQWNDPSFRDRRVDMSAHAVGRLKPGITLAQAAADMDAIAHRLAAAFPEADKDAGIQLVPMKQDIVGNVQPFLLVLLAAVAFLLLIACTNVASLLLAALGGVAGLALAFWSTRAIVAALPSALPRSDQVAMDWRVLVFTLVVSLLSGIVFGLAPALRSSRVSLVETLKQTGRGSSGTRHRMQGAFVAVEVALALILLVGAGLMIRSLAALWRVDPGFTADHAITFDLSMPSSARTTSAETRERLRRFDAAMRAIPGVKAVSVTLGSRPMIHDSELPFWIQGEPRPANDNDMHQAMFYLVEAGFRQAMGIVLERGRFVTSQDDESAPVVVDIDDVFARTYFPRQNPVGKHIHLAEFDNEAEIVGVVGHVKQWGPGNDAKSPVQAEFFYPFMQLPEKLMPLTAQVVAVVLRTEGDPNPVMRPVRRTVAELDPGEVIYAVETLNDVLSGSLAARRLTMILLGVFALLALVLACVGIYGVISYLVGERTREIGVRIALGARRSDVLRLILGQGAKMALVGVALGIAVALVLTRLIRNQLYGVSAHDPLTFAAVAFALVLVALAACYIPARRAMQVDPMVALRNE